MSAPLSGTLRFALCCQLVLRLENIGNKKRQILTPHQAARVLAQKADNNLFTLKQ
jgi:hypothetical protein